MEVVGYLIPEYTSIHKANIEKNSISLIKTIDINQSMVIHCKHV